MGRLRLGKGLRPGAWMARQEWREPTVPGPSPPPTSSCSGGSDDARLAGAASRGLSRAPRPELCPRRAVSLPPKLVSVLLPSPAFSIDSRLLIAIRLAFHRPEGLGAICRLGKFMLFSFQGKKKKKRLLHKMDSSTFLQEGWSHLSGRRPPALSPRRCTIQVQSHALLSEPCFLAEPLRRIPVLPRRPRTAPGAPSGLRRGSS